MQRVFFTAVLLLASGAAVNIFVAWTCEAFARWPTGTPGHVLSEAPSSEALAVWGEHFAASAQSSHAQTKFGLHQIRWLQFGAMRLRLCDLRLVHRPSIELVRSGWPMHSLSGLILTDPFARQRVRRHNIILIRDFWRTGTGTGDVELPMWPLAVGFIINTMFYVVIVVALYWAAVTILRAARRSHRRRRGLCPNCGYDLRGGEHHTCPECGVVVFKGKIRTFRACLIPSSA